MVKVGKMLQTGVLLVALVCIFAGCGKDETPQNKVYSLTVSPVANGAWDTVKYDLSFLSNNNLVLIDACWVDANRLLCLASSAGSDFYGEEDGVIQQKAALYMLNTGDFTLEVLYEGEGTAVKLQQFPNNQVAVVGLDSFFIFNYEKSQLVTEVALEQPEEDLDQNQSHMDELVPAPSGKSLVRGDGNGGLIIGDISGKTIAEIVPADLGYNWLSSPLWSNDGKNLVFICGYQPYSADNIAVVVGGNYQKPVILDYEKSPDVRPYTPDVGTGLIIMNSFFNNPDNLPKTLDFLQMETGKLKGQLPITRLQGFVSLVFANTASNSYYFSCEGRLYHLFNAKDLEMISPEGVMVQMDNSYVEPKTEAVALVSYDSIGNTDGIYVIKKK